MSYTTALRADHDHDLVVGMQMPHSVQHTLGRQANQRHSSSFMTGSLLVFRALCVLGRGDVLDNCHGRQSGFELRA